VRHGIASVDKPVPEALGRRASDTEDIFAEMRPYMVNVPNVDNTREAIYTRMEGE
jgi:hypothetical protein